MGDYFNIELNIGGQCDRQKLERLVNMAISYGFYMAWSDGMDKQQFIESIEEAIKSDPEVAIQLTGLQVRMVDYDNLMDWLRDNGLFYQGNCAAVGEYDSERHLYLPGLNEELIWSQLDAEAHEVHISLESLRAMRDAGHDIDYVIARLHRFDQEAPKFELGEIPH